MSNSKLLWVLTGGNGAGKSTFYNLYLAKYGIKFVNVNLIAKDFYKLGCKTHTFRLGI